MPFGLTNAPAVFQYLPISVLWEGTSVSTFPLTDGKVHPCTFFSHRLTPTETWYDVGDRELKVKMALEE